MTDRSASFSALVQILFYLHKKLNSWDLQTLLLKDITLSLMFLMLISLLSNATQVLLMSPTCWLFTTYVNFLNPSPVSLPYNENAKFCERHQDIIKFISSYLNKNHLPNLNISIFYILKTSFMLLSCYFPYLGKIPNLTAVIAKLFHNLHTVTFIHLSCISPTFHSVS